MSQTPPKRQQSAFGNLPKAMLATIATSALVFVISILSLASGSLQVGGSGVSYLANVYSGTNANCSYPTAANLYNACRVGAFDFDQSGTYTFTMEAVGGARVYINEELAIDSWNQTVARKITQDVQITAGTVPIRIESRDYTPSSSVALTWDYVDPVVEDLITIRPVDGTGGDVTLGDGDLSDNGEQLIITEAQADAFNIMLEYVGTETVGRFNFVLVDTGSGREIQNRSEAGAPYAVLTDNGTDANPTGLAFGSYQIDVQVVSTNGVVLAEDVVAFTLLEEGSASSDTTPPSRPTLDISGSTDSTVDVAVGNLIDDVAVVTWVLVRDGQVVHTGAGNTNTYTDSGLLADIAYTYVVRAYDLAGNVSEDSVAVVAQTQPTETVGCAMPATVGVFTECQFSDIELNNLVRVGQVNDIDYEWQDGGPSAELTNNFSMRWLGRKAFRQTGQYEFSMTVDDGGRLYVDGQRVLDSWKKQAATEYTTVVTVEEGVHDIRFEYYEATGWATAKFDVKMLTEGTPDITPPAQPVVTVQNPTTSSVDLVFSNISDNVDVASIQVNRDGEQIARLPGTARSYVDTGLSVERSYKYTIQSIDAAGNVSQLSDAVTGTTIAGSGPGCSSSGQAGEFTACYYSGTDFNSFVRSETVGAVDYDWGTSAPAGLPADGFSVRWFSTINVPQSKNYIFTVSTDDGMRVLVDGVNVLDAWQNQAVTNYLQTVFLSAGEHSLVVEYYEDSGAAVAQFDYQPIGGSGGDTESPSVPNIGLSDVGSSYVTLSVANLVDNIGVAVVEVERDGSMIATSGGTQAFFTDAGLQPNTTYSYRVRALDDAGNASGYSSLLSITTPSNITPPPATTGTQFLYDNYEKPLGGLWRYSLHAPADRIDFDSLLDQFQNGAVTNVNSGMSVSQINSAIANAPAGGVVKFAGGTYNITGTIWVQRDDIRLEFDTGTVFKMNITPGYNKYAIRVQGGGVASSKTTVTGGLSLYSKSIQVANASTFKAGDWVQVVAPAEAGTYTSANTWTLPNGKEVNRRAVIAKVVSVSGNTVNFDRRLPFPPQWIYHTPGNTVYQDGYAYAEKLNMIENVVLTGDLRITYTDIPGLGDASVLESYPATNQIVNHKSSWALAGGISAIMMQYVANSGFAGIEIQDAPSTHMSLYSSADIKFDDIFFNGAWNVGEGGNGYAINMDGVTNVEATNLESDVIRHDAPATGLRYSSTAVHIHYKRLSTNFDLHGSYDWGITGVIDNVDYWHGHCGFRLTDFREVRVKEFGNVWIKKVTDSGCSSYDWIFSTYPGSTENLTFHSDPEGHRPGWRLLPGGKYSEEENQLCYVNGAPVPCSSGHMDTWIISMSGPSTVVLNPGSGTLTLGGVRGTNIIIPPLASGEVINRTITGWKSSNNSKSPQPDKIWIPKGLAGYQTASDVYAAMNGSTIPLGGSSSVTIVGGTPEIVVVEEAILKRYQWMNYFSQVTWDTRPYLTEVTPDPGQQSTGVISHTFSEDIQHNPSAGTGYILSSDGSVALQLNPSQHFTINGSTVVYNLPGLNPGQEYRFELPPFYFQSMSTGKGTFAIFDWDSVSRPDYSHYNVTTFRAPFSQ